MACSACRKRKLRCDGDQPTCSNCIRLKQTCEYLKPTQTRRSAKETNYHVESVQVVDKSKPRPVPVISVTTDILGAVDAFALYNNRNEGDRLSTTDTTPNESDSPKTPFGYGFAELAPKSEFPDSYLTFHEDDRVRLTMPVGHRKTWLSDTATEELTEVFFREVYPSIPIVHKSRYYASLRLPPAQQPPLCLRFAMLALGAVHEQKYGHLANSLYETARAYLEQDESKASGTDVLNVAHVQCWSLIATYESYMLLSLRTWSSIRRASALAHVLRLHTIDELDESTEQLLPETQDPSEIEERRRAFWSAFTGDKWISSTTGYPTTIGNLNITTKLPGSEQSFVSGSLERTQSLDDVLEAGFNPSTSLYGARAVLACVLGRVMKHVESATSSNKTTDIQEFWAQHSELDALLSKISVTRSADLRPSSTTTDPKLWALDMWLHGLSICLHQTAVDSATKENNQEQIVESLKQCREAADHIIVSIRSTAHIETKKMDPFTASCVYMAGTVLIQGRAHRNDRATDIEDLRYLERVLELMHKHWKVTEVFITQFKEDLANGGIKLLADPNADLEVTSRKRAGHMQPTHRRSPSERLLSGILPVV